MEDDRMPKAVDLFYGELVQGKRICGAPRKRYKDQLRRQLRAADIHEVDWETQAPGPKHKPGTTGGLRRESNSSNRTGGR